MYAVKATTDNKIGIIKLLDDDLEKQLQCQVGGSIEIEFDLKIADMENIILIVDRDGVKKVKQVNKIASMIHKRHTVVGDVIFVKSTKEGIAGLSNEEASKLFVQLEFKFRHPKTNMEGLYHGKK